MYIHAQSVREVAPGIYEVIPHQRPVSDEEREVLTRLFPHLGEQVHELLDKESLLQSIAEDYEVTTAIKKDKDTKDKQPKFKPN